MPEMRDSLLGGTGADPNEPVRREPSGLSLSQVWNNRGMGEETMRVTFVGALIIVAVAIAVAVILGALLNKTKRGPNQPNTGMG